MRYNTCVTMLNIFIVSYKIIFQMQEMGEFGDQSVIKVYWKVYLRTVFRMANSGVNFICYAITITTIL